MRIILGRLGKMNLIIIFTIMAILVTGLASPAFATEISIDNDIPSGTLGHFEIEMQAAGESRDATITAEGFASGVLETEEVIFDYFTYIDTGNGGFRLSDTTTSGPTLTGDDEVTSSGSFTGSNDNTIQWTATSGVVDGERRLVTGYAFSAEGFELGNIRLYQYLDEDIDGVSDDIFFTRGTVAAGTFELFTLDDSQAFGVSHSGGFSESQGLVNSVYVGFAADEFDDIRDEIEAGTQDVSISGVIDTSDLPLFNHPVVGPARGPADIVSVMAWDVVPTAINSGIVTTLGGVATLEDIDPEPGDPEQIPVPDTTVSGVDVFSGPSFALDRDYGQEDFFCLRAVGTVDLAGGAFTANAAGVVVSPITGTNTGAFPGEIEPRIPPPSFPFAALLIGNDDLGFVPYFIPANSGLNDQRIPGPTTLEEQRTMDELFGIGAGVGTEIEFRVNDSNSGNTGAFEVSNCLVPEPEPEPITEIQCDVSEETQTEIEILENGITFSVPGTCDVHRGESFETKDVSIEVTKDIPELAIPEASDVDLSLWTEESFGLATWTVQEGGISVFQSQNGAPTFFYSPFDAFNTQIVGQITVETAGDDDFVGFALGFQSGDVTNPDADYLLIDWKQLDQTFNFGGNSSPGGFAGKGLAVSRVTGVPDQDEFWQHADLDQNNSGAVTELARGINLGQTGWNDNQTYEFEFVFTESNLKVFVDGVLEIDIEGDFSDGRIAFYNFSQTNVRYAGFDVTPVSTVFDETGTFVITFLDGSGTITVSEVGIISLDPEGQTFVIDGTITGAPGTGDYSDIPQCGELFFTAVDNNDSASGSISITQCQVTSSGGGGMNHWDKRPTFGISHETRQDQVVENGFSFNSEYFTLTDNHWTDFEEQSVEIGTINTFSATVYADKKLKVQEFLFGIPNVGEAHLAELGVEIWYDINGEIEDVVVVQNSHVIDADTVSVSHEMTKCLPTDAEAKCDTTTVSMKFLEPLQDKVMAIKAIDHERRDQRTFLNDGFDISGESLNPMLTNMIPSAVRYEGLLKVTQVAKYSPYWVADDDRMFEMNSFGSFKQINQSFERFQDTGDARTRLHSGYGGIIAYEQNRALDIFDAGSLVSELPASFAYIFPETGERINEEMRQAMLVQEQIAKEVLDQMDRQQRNH